MNERILSPDEMKLIWELTKIWYNRELEREVPRSNLSPDRLMLRDALRHTLTEYLDLLDQMEKGESGFPIDKVMGPAMCARLLPDGRLEIKKVELWSPDK